MPLKRELTAVTQVLAEEENAERSAEEVAEAVIRALDEVRSEHNRLAVVVRHRWGTDGAWHMAVLGPVGVRQLSAAKALGEAAAFGLAASGGEGRYALVPAYPNPRAAWAEIKPPSRADVLREQVARDIVAREPGLSMWATGQQAVPTCCCGLLAGNPCRVHPKAG